VIQHEALPRQPRRKLRRGRQMATIYEDVVREVELFEERQSLDERPPQQEAIVRLGLRDVTDADQLRVPGKDLEIGARARRLQIDPADDAGDEWMRSRRAEAPARDPAAGNRVAAPSSHRRSRDTAPRRIARNAGARRRARPAAS